VRVDYPRLVFEQPFDERLAYEVEQKGWCGIALVEVPNGTRFRVFFYDPIRLAQDLETDLKSGEFCIAEPGMIVVPTVSREHMENAVRRLYEKGYFQSLVPTTEAGGLGS
jgi:hypothetical protein